MKKKEWRFRFRILTLVCAMAAGAVLPPARSFAHPGHDIVLGEYYYPRGGSAWIPRGTKTVFSRGDTIIIKDSRVTLGRGAVGGTIPYILNDRLATIDRGTIRLNPAEFPDLVVNGTSLWGAEGSEQWALGAYVDVDQSTVSASITWYDIDARGEGQENRIVEEVFKGNLATIVPLPTTTTTSSTSTTTTSSTTSTTTSSTTTTTLPPGSKPGTDRRRP